MPAPPAMMVFPLGHGTVSCFVNGCIACGRLFHDLVAANPRRPRRSLSTLKALGPLRALSARSAGRATGAAWPGGSWPRLKSRLVSNGNHAQDAFSQAGSPGCHAETERGRIGRRPVLALEPEHEGHSVSLRGRPGPNGFRERIAAGRAVQRLAWALCDHRADAALYGHDRGRGLD
jgi:hypothetical protein